MPARTLMSACVATLLLAACGKPAEPPAAPAAPVTADAPPATAVAPPPAPAPAPAAPAATAVETVSPPAAPAAQVAAAAGADVVKGWKTWRSAACERCHGAAQEGMVGPSLIESLKRLSKDDVRKVVLEGRLERGMPGHPYLADKFDDLYAYLKGRSDSSIARVRPDGA